jgi:hypothetical protein
MVYIIIFNTFSKTTKLNANYTCKRSCRMLLVVILSFKVIALVNVFLYVYMYFKNWECHLFKKYKIGNIVGGIQLSLKTNATRIYIVQYTTRCVKTLIIVIQTITKSDK